MAKFAILIVEDDPTMQSVMHLLAKRFDIVAEVVETCEQALSVLETHHDFAMILMDWHLPDRTGLECAEFVRRLNQDSPQRMPIIAMTASVMPGDRELCLNGGMDDYLAKPFTIDEFGRMLRKWSQPQTPQKSVAEANFSCEDSMHRL